MKPVITLLLLSCLGCVSYGQEMASIFDKNAKITWLGLDFTGARLEASIWITFINMDSKQGYFSERMIGKPSGFGMRNYWANAIFDILKLIRKREFEMWRKKYYRKF